MFPQKKKHQNSNLIGIDNFNAMMLWHFGEFRFQTLLNVYDTISVIINNKKKH